MAAAVFALLVAAFYVVLGPYIGNTLAGNILLITFSFSVRSTSISALTELLQVFFAPLWSSFGCSIDDLFRSKQAAATAALYVRCTAVDPSDRTDAKKTKRRRQLARGGGGTAKLPRLRYGYILWRYAVRLLRRVEARVTNRWVRRSYLEQWNTSVQLDPMLPFAFTSLDDIVSPCATADGHDISFCPICDCEVFVSFFASAYRW